MTPVGSDWSRSARERRRHFKTEGLSPKLAAQIVRAERNAKNRLASAIGRQTADKARLAYIDGDPQPVKLLLDDCHLNDEQRAKITPLCSGFTRDF
jgi:dihydrodipicolinate synthase/N-acetylneuraminate lyase